MANYFINAQAGIKRQLYADSTITIKAKPGETYRLIDENTDKTPLTITTTRRKKDLVIVDSKDNATIVVEGFWEVCKDGDLTCQLVIEQMGGGVTTINQSNTLLTSLSTGGAGSINEPTLLKQEVQWGPYKGVDVGSSALHGGATAGVVYAILRYFDSADDTNSQAAAPANVDTTPPNAPALFASQLEGADGLLTVFGAAEAGSTVTITLPDQTTITATADALTGAFSVNSPTAQRSGVISATASDASNNISPRTTIQYTDQPPAAPILFVEQSSDNDARIHAFGAAEAFAVVTVTFPDSSTQTIKTDATGEYSIVSTAVQNTGAVSATATDAGGNVSPATTVQYVDAAPELPLVVVVDAGLNNGTVLIKGITEPNATVQITLPVRGVFGNTEVVTFEADDKGLFEGLSTLNQGDGDVTMVATDINVNTANTVFVYDDIVPAAAITVPRQPNGQAYLRHADGSVTIAGSGEPGSALTITMPNTQVLTTTIDAEGRFSVTSGPNQPTGRVTCTQVDLGGNQSVCPMLDHQSVPARPLIFLQDTGLEDGRFIVVGMSEPGALVTIVFPNQSERITNGETLMVVATSNGTFSVALDYAASFSIATAFAKGDTFVSATATNEVGVSPVTSGNFNDTIKPGLIKDFVIEPSAANPNVFVFSGQAEPWSTVVVHVGESRTTVFTDASGNFSGQTQALPRGLALDVAWVLTDIGGNTIYSPNLAPVNIPAEPDVTGPTVVVTTEKTALNTSDNQTFVYFTANEPIRLNVSKLVVTGGTFTLLGEQLDTGGTVLVGLFTANNNYDGPLTINVPTDSVTDRASTPNNALSVTNLINTTIDTIAPTVSLEGVTDPLSDGDITTVTMQFSEDVGDTLTLDDFVSAGGVASNLQQSPTNPLLWTVDFTIAETQNNESILSLGSNTYLDPAGNINLDGLDTNNSVTFNVVL